MAAYFSVLFTKQEMFSGKTFVDNENHKSFPLKHFIIYGNLQTYVAKDDMYPMRMADFHKGQNTSNI